MLTAGRRFRYVQFSYRCFPWVATVGWSALCHDMTTARIDCAALWIAL
jgi:hypothetical protein